MNVPNDLGPLYTETRMDRLPVEPFNTASNLAFLLVILLLLRRLRRNGWRGHGVTLLALAIVAAGFVLTVRVLRTHVSRAYDLEIHLRVEPHALRRHRRHLRLWRIRADGDLDERAFPPYVDVFPYVVADGHMHILDSGQRLELRCPLHSPISLPGGVCVPVEDPSYIDALRESRARSRAAGPDADRRLAPAGARKR